MYLIPLLRINRALASSLILPNEPIKAIALSETISLIGPFLNPYVYKKIINVITTLLFIPDYTSYVVNYYNQENLKYHQIEICTILLFNFFLFINMKIL